MLVQSLGWLGVRTANTAGMRALLRDALKLDVLQDLPGDARFRLADGTEVHVYGADDAHHAFFGEGPVVGLRVDSFRAAQAALIEHGLEFVYPDAQRQGGSAWQHFRGPDGNIYEIIGPDDLEDGDTLRVRPLAASDLTSAVELWRDRWGTSTVVSSSGVHDLTAHPGLIAELGGKMLGVASYRLSGSDCELLALDSIQQGVGVGSALLEQVTSLSASKGCTRVWLITTNDNVDALRFYQRHGFELIQFHRDALVQWRLQKPEIPEHGLQGIPMCHALELQLCLPAHPGCKP